MSGSDILRLLEFELDIFDERTIYSSKNELIIHLFITNQLLFKSLFRNNRANCPQQ